MTKEFFKKMGIRALYTVAETALGILGSSVLLSEVNWPELLSASVLAGLISCLKSVIVGLPEAEKR